MISEELATSELNVRYWRQDGVASRGIPTLPAMPADDYWMASQDMTFFAKSQWRFQDHIGPNQSYRGDGGVYDKGAV